MIHKIVWEVIHWEKLWRTLWFPTANISYIDTSLENAVFHIHIIIDGKIYSGMWTHMVFKKLFEAHIFNFDEDVYGKTIEVLLLKKIRDNKKFDSLQELTTQIENDQKIIKQQKLPVLTFWSFDYIHKWHEYYLSEAKKYGNHLVTIVASDENIERIKKQKPLYPLTQRVEELKKMNISDEVIPGSNTQPMKWINLYKPHVICLWYDQRWPFVDALQWEIKKLWLETMVITIQAHHPSTYKSSILKTKK